MPITPTMLKPRFAQVGAIRLGEKITRNGKTFPGKLNAFRFTTPSPRIAEELAAVFSGEPKPWRNGNSPEWEVYSTTSEIEVLVPPQHVDPNFEIWGPGVRLRKCDGVTESIRGQECMCRKAFGDDFTRTAPKDKVCKPTFRASFMIRDLPIGTFKLEGHGWNAISEMPELINALSRASVPIPGTLMLVQQQKAILNPTAPQDKQIEQRNFVVPRFIPSGITAGQVFGNQLEAAARQALGVGTAVADGGRPALAAAPAPTATPWTPERVIDAAKQITALPELQALWTAAGKDGALTDQVKQVLEARSKELQPTPAKKATPAAAAKPAPAVVTPEPAKDEIVDAELVDDAPVTTAQQMNGAQAWQAALELGHAKSWNRNDLADRFLEKYGCDYRDDNQVSDEMLVGFLAAIQSGEVA